MAEASPKHSFIPSLGTEGKMLHYPDLGAYRASRAAMISKILAHPLNDLQITESFGNTRQLYFVNIDFSHFENSINKIYSDMAELFSSPSLPSRNDLKALWRKEPLCLFSVLRLKDCFDQIKSSEHPVGNLIFRREASNGISEGTVVPSMRLAEPSKLKAMRKLLKLEESAIQREIFDINHHYVPDGHLANILEIGFHTGKAGSRTGFYFITTKFAKMLYDSFQRSAGVKKLQVPPMNILFPEDPTLGPGNGTYCRAFPIKYGNAL